ncbi:hypothetical protein WS61_02440 [Burkholderia sp. ABCPW 11]|nr:hypothetical protein WS61_02440 [Burkholderia sp. ABCPW 11]
MVPLGGAEGIGIGQLPTETLNEDFISELAKAMAQRGGYIDKPACKDRLHGFSLALKKPCHASKQAV